MMRSGIAFLHRALAWITGCAAAALLLGSLVWHPPAMAQQAGQVVLNEQEIAWRKQHPVIRVGVFAGDHLPAESWVAGRPEGMAIDYVQLLAARVGLRLEFRPYADWVAVTYAKPGQDVPYDLLSAMPVRDDVGRYQHLKPYTRVFPMLVARKGDLVIRTERDLPGARIAVDRDFHDLIAEIQKHYPSARLVYANSSRDAMNLVAANQADAYIGLSEAHTRLLLQQRERDDLSLLSFVTSLRPRDVSPALPNSNPMLFQLLQKAEASVTPAELEQIRQRWGLAASTMGLAATSAVSKEDREWLRNQRPLRVGFESDRPPYSFVNAEGRFDGLAADYMELIRKELDLQVELVPAKDWNSLQRMVRAREVDLVAAAMPEDFSAQDMLFSRPYEHFPEVIVTRQQGPAVAGPEDLGGRVVAAREEAGLLPRLMMLLPNSRIVPVGSNEAGLDLVAEGKADAYIGTLPAIDPLIRDSYAASLRISGPAGIDQDFAVGVTTEYRRLLPMVDTVLRGVSDEQRQRIRSRWLTADYRFGVPWVWVLGGLGVAALVLLIVGAAYSRSRKALEAKQVAEQELAAQLAFQQALLETVPYPVFVKDTQGRYLAVNQAYETMFGCHREQLLGRDITQTAHVQGEDIQTLHEADLEVMHSGHNVERELRLHTPSAGGFRDVLMWLHAFNSASGEVGGLLGTLVDVTNIREAEARARASEQRLKETNEQLPGAIIRVRVHPSGAITFDHVTGQDQALFGRDLSMLHGKEAPKVDTILSEDRPRIDAAMDRLRRTHAPTTIEFRTLVNGSVRWVRAVGGAPRVLPNGDLLWSVYCGDVTTEKEQARALEEAKATAEAGVAAKSAFLAMMSHEIRTPMAGVLGLIELMAQSRLDSEQKHMLGLVQDSAVTLLQILDDVLDFSRIDSGRLELESRPFDLRALADGVIGLFAARAQEKGVRLHATIDWRLAGEFSGDAVRVRQIITNLISNALKFTQKGHVELRIELAGEARAAQDLRFTVADTGIGISREQLDRLFQPFVQAESSITRRFGGTGLGLTICRRLAQLMGGDIHLESTEGLGTQAIFEVRFTVVRPMTPQPELAGKTALLCTQDAMLERELSNTLSTLGFNLIEVEADELHDFTADDIDLFVLDNSVVKDGLLPAGGRCLRLVDSPDPRGFHADTDGVSLSANPLLWRSALEACHAVFGLPSPQAIPVDGDVPVHRPGRILVAEDHPINRVVISRQLERLGYSHTLVENGELAWQALSKARYDLLISDCHMPVLDGYELARRIRASEAGSGRHLPIVALSAGALPEQVKRCRDSGMDDFLAKPVQLHELEERLSAHLEGRTGVREEPAEYAAAPAAPHSQQLMLLMSTFGDAAQVRQVLSGLLETSRQDAAELDDALARGDDAQAREVLHRISGALALLSSDPTQEASPDLSLPKRREDLLKRLDALDRMIHDIDASGAAAEQGLT